MGAALKPRAAIAAERPASWLGRALYGSARALSKAAVRIVFRLRIENAPALDSSYVVVANHASFLDPILIGGALPRRATFLMTVLHFRSPLLGWFYRWMRCIPLALRGTNREPLRVARLVLGRGEVLAMFPEGGISRDGKMLCGSPGAVSLVLNQEVPIVAAHIEGAARLHPRGRLTVRFADPILLDDLLREQGPIDRRQRLRVATRLIMDRIAATGGVVSREAWLEARRSD